MGSVNLWKSHSQEVVETPSLESFSAKWKNCSIKEDYPTLEEEGLDEQYVFSIFNFYSFGKKKKEKENWKKEQPGGISWRKKKLNLETTKEQIWAKEQMGEKTH